MIKWWSWKSVLPTLCQHLETYRSILVRSISVSQISPGILVGFWTAISTWPTISSKSVDSHTITWRTSPTLGMCWAMQKVTETRVHPSSLQGYITVMAWCVWNSLSAHLPASARAELGCSTYHTNQKVWPHFSYAHAGSSTGCRCPSALSLKTSWYGLTVRCMACHQITSQTYWSPMSLLALCVLREGTWWLCSRQDSDLNGDRRFAQAAPTPWNSLPLNNWNADSWNAFNRMLKTHLFSGAM